MLRPTFLSFETAKKALTSSQLGLDTVGHNIANINTQGYTRQRIDQVSISQSTRNKYIAHNSIYPGLGSEVIGINQIRDPFLDKRYRTEAANCGEYSAISNGLTEINGVFDEIMSTGSYAKMGEFLSALDKLILEADSKEHASVLRNKADQIAKVLNQNSISLDSVETQMREELDHVTTDINKLLSQISTLNKKIWDDNFYGNPANELNDERNMLLDQLSELVDIEVKRTPVELSGGIVLEQLSIEIKGSGNPSKGVDPIVLLDGQEYNGLTSQIDPDTGAASIHLTNADGALMSFRQTDGSLTSDVTDKLFTGTLKGYMCILNGKGTMATSGENGFKGIPYYREALNDYTAKFADVMNKMNELEVYGPNGPFLDASGNPVTISRPLFVSNDGGPITAANLTVSDEWAQNPQYIDSAKKNNALYVDAAGMLYLQDDDTATGINIANVAGVDKDGFLLDTNGDKLKADGSPVVNDNETAVNIADLQRAITEDTTFYAFDIANYTDNGTATGNIMLKHENGKVDSGLPGPAYADNDGKLWTVKPTDPAFNSATDALMYGSPSKQLTKSDLFQVTTGGPGVDYKPGDRSPNELLPGEAANDNLLQLKDTLKGNTSFSNGFSGSFQEFLSGSFLADMALDLELNDTKLDSTLSVLYGLADSRDAISAVSLDEEGINMMTYQNYYNAAARYMTTLDEALGTIIQNMGVVGR